MISVDTPAATSACLSFVAIDRARRLFGLCPRKLSLEIGRMKRGVRKDGEKFGSLGNRRRRTEDLGSSSQLFGCFEFDVDQVFEEGAIPVAVASPFAALGKRLSVFRAPDPICFELISINVTVNSPRWNSPMGDLLELDLIEGTVSRFIDGALLVDDDGRGVCLLVGSSPSKFYAVSLLSCLIEFELGAVGTSEILRADDRSSIDEFQQELETFSQIDSGEPVGQHAEIMVKLQREGTYV